MAVSVDSVTKTVRLWRDKDRVTARFVTGSFSMSCLLLGETTSLDKA